MRAMLSAGFLMSALIMSRLSPITVGAARKKR